MKKITAGYKLLILVVLLLLFWHGPVRLVFVCVAVPAFLFGYFLQSQPLKMFEIQKRFYARLNWRIEPISLQKEIRNTKVMGWGLMVFVVVAALFIILRD